MINKLTLCYQNIILFFINLSELCVRAHACFCYQFLFDKISYRFNPILLEHTQRHQITRLATLRLVTAVTSAMQLRPEQAKNGAHLIADRLRRNAAIATRQSASLL